MSDPLDCLPVEQIRVDVPVAEDDFSIWRTTDCPVVSVQRRASVAPGHSNEGQSKQASCPRLSNSAPEANVCTCTLLKRNYQGWANSGCAQCVNTPRMYTEFPRRTPKRTQAPTLKRTRRLSLPTSCQDVRSLLEKRRDLLPAQPAVPRPRTKQKPQKLLSPRPAKQCSAERWVRPVSLAHSKLRGQWVHRCFNFLIAK